MANIFSYFDLNKRFHQGVKSGFPASTYEIRLPETIAQPSPTVTCEPSITREVAVVPEEIDMPGWRQWLMYLGIAIGVLFSPLVNQLKSGSAVSINFTATIVIISLVVSLALIPIVYEKLIVKPNTPFIYQFGLFVQHGLFWNVLFDTIGKAMVT